MQQRRGVCRLEAHRSLIVSEDSGIQCSHHVEGPLVSGDMEGEEEKPEVETLFQAAHRLTGISVKREFRI